MIGHVIWNSVVEADEVCFGYHHRVAKTAVVDCALDFFGEEITGVDDAWDVCDMCRVVLMGFADFVFAEGNVFSSFVGHGG